MKRAMLWSVVGLVAWSGWAHAQLKWEKTEAELTGTLNDKELKAEYAFSNTGAYPITVREVKPGPDCVADVSDKKTYQAGEAGKLTIRLRVGQAQGKQSRKIEVRSDDRNTPLQMLTLNAHLPELVAMEPRVLTWKKGEKDAAKSTTVTVLREQPIKVIGVRVTQFPKLPPDAALPPGAVPLAELKLTAASRETRPGREYQVTVTPLDLSAEGQAMVEVETDLPGAWRIQRLQIRVVDQEATRKRMVEFMTQHPLGGVPEGRPAANQRLAP